MESGEESSDTAVIRPTGISLVILIIRQEIKKLSDNEHVSELGEGG